MLSGVPMIFLSVPGLIISALLVLIVVGIAIFRRPDMRRSSEMLVLLGLVLLMLAGGELAYLQSDPREIAVMVDLSASTRGARYRDSQFLQQRIRTLLGANPYRVIYFSDENRMSVAQGGQLADLPSA